LKLSDILVAINQQISAEPCTSLNILTHTRQARNLFGAARSIFSLFQFERSIFQN